MIALVIARQGHQLRRGAPVRRFHRADAHGERAARNRRAQPHEGAALEIPEHFGLAALHAQQIGGAGHVDVEKGAAHQEVGGLRRHILGELGEALGGDDPRQPALAATAHQIGHGRETHAARLLRPVGGGGGGEELGLVHDHEGGKPVFAVRVEEGVEEDGGAAQLPIRLQLLQIEHHGNAMLAHPRRDQGQLMLGGGGVHHHMAVAVGEGHVVALGVDDDLLHEPRALFQQAAQQMGLAGARVALHQQAGREQLLEIDHGRRIGARHPYVDINRHPFPESCAKSARAS